MFPILRLSCDSIESFLKNRSYASPVFFCGLTVVSLPWILLAGETSLSFKGVVGLRILGLIWWFGLAVLNLFEVTPLLTELYLLCLYIWWIL